MVFIGIPFVVIYLLFFSYSIQQQALKESLNQQKIPFEGQIMDVNASEKKNSAHFFNDNSTTEQTGTAPQNGEIAASKILVFRDTSNKKTFQLPLDKLYYINSAQNYIEIFHENTDGQIKRTVLRNTLKLIEGEMIDAEKLPLIRCHKAFIVNREKILELTNSSKSAQFILKNIDTPIPISRDKIQEYKGQFSTTSDLV
jgi:DNA-binding LytR/AlgR family response regulator